MTSRKVSNLALPPEIMDRVLIAGMEALGYDVKNPKKTLKWLRCHGEPSDAQVDAAARVITGEHFDILSEQSLRNIRGTAREVLRAAAGVGQEGSSDG